MSNNDFLHKSVLLDEVVDWLVTDKQGIYVDCTLGGGGHARALGERLESSALLVGIDQDMDAILAAREKLKDLQCKVKIINSNFSDLGRVLKESEIENVSGILFDLGVSSYQLDTAERGFSYMQDGFLDMRMSSESKLTAFTVVNSYQEKELADIIWRYGEERWAKRIASFIVAQRAEQKISTTFELVSVIKKAVPKEARKDGPHPAKRTFQAIRIEVNNELGILESAFTTAVESLVAGGRIGIITFHSLEDRIAKQTLNKLAKGCCCPVSIPICICNKKAVVKSVKAKTPTDEEVQSNPRARSARLRMAVKI